MNQPSPNDTIAETSFDFIRPNGTKGTVRAWIGRPSRDPEYSECPCGLDGLESRAYTIRGEDRMQALGLALKFVYTRLRDEMKKGLILFYPRTTDQVTPEILSVFFAQHQRDDRT